MFARVTGILLGIVFVVLTGCSSAGVNPEIYTHGDPIPADSTAVLRWVTDLGPGGYTPGEDATAYTDPGVLGEATSSSTDVVVLGRGGSITLDLGSPVADGDGAELAVWENGFYYGGGLFAELAYVEASSDGTAFARFPVVCTAVSTVGSAGSIDTTDYAGFAGLYPAGTGTAFDLAELSAEPDVVDGTVDLSAVRYVRIVDVVGDGSEFDESEPPHPIYDPYPTTGTAGFDLNAVAVLE